MEEDPDEEVPDWIFDVEEISSKNLNNFARNPLKFTEEYIVIRIYSLGRILSQVFHQFGFHYWTSGGIFFAFCIIFDKIIRQILV